MKKSTILIIFISLLCPFLNSVDIEHYFPDTLRSKLLSKAETNIENLLPEQKKSMRELLKRHPNALMGFLISSEQNSILQNTDPQIIESQYQNLIEMIRINPNWKELPPKFYLSYVAKMTVSDEELTPYREEFKKEGIKKILNKATNEKDIIRELNLWVRKYLTFKRSTGRDQTPITMLRKSNIGRCEEEQIFFIAAARTIGMPARPAWTPWWANSNSNHAWVEVYVDDKWHYIGAAEPKFNLDQAWFSNKINQSMLIIAESVFPDSSEKIIYEGKYLKYINSTPNYMKTKKVNFLVKDSLDQPVSDAEISIKVFNYKSLRPLVNLKSDSLGKTQIEIGQGSCLVTAWKDSLFDYQLLPLQKKDEVSCELILKQRNWEDHDIVLAYPPPKKLNFPQPKPAWVDYKKSIIKQYNERIKSFQVDSTFSADSTIRQIFELARGNKRPLLKFIDSNKKINDKFWEIVVNMDEKFFWEASEDNWNFLYKFYKKIENDSLSLKDEIKRELLSPTVFFETISDSPDLTKYSKWTDNPFKKRIKTIIEYLKDNYEINKEKSIKGLLPFNQLAKLKYLSKTQFKILTAYYLKYNLIPVRYTRIPDILSIYHNKTWQYYVISENQFKEENKADSLTVCKTNIKITDSTGRNIELSYKHYGTTYFSTNRFRFNDRQLKFNDSLSCFTGKLNPGKYELLIAQRPSSEETCLKLYNLHITESMNSFRDTIIFKNYKRYWEKAPDKLISFLNKDDFDKDTIILLGNYDNEPIQRLAAKIQAEKDTQSFMWLGLTESPDAPSLYSISESLHSLYQDNTITENQLTTIYYDKNQNQFLYFKGNWDKLPD